jgi:hypothetical protein
MHENNLNTCAAYPQVDNLLWKLSMTVWAGRSWTAHPKTWDESLDLI